MSRKKGRPARSWRAARAHLDRAISRWMQQWGYDHAAQVTAWMNEAGCTWHGRPVLVDDVRQALRPPTGQGAAPLPAGALERECRTADLERRAAAWADDQRRSQRNALWAADDP